MEHDKANEQSSTGQPSMGQPTLEEIQNLIATSERLAKHAIMDLLSEYDEKFKVPKDEPWGFMQISFDEFPDKLNINLIKVDASYRSSIMIPAGYEKQLFEKYNIIKSMAITYWAYIIQTSPNIKARLNELHPTIDFSELKVDKANPTTLYFDEHFHKRIGIFCCYMDADGKLFDYKNDGEVDEEVLKRDREAKQAQAVLQRELAEKHTRELAQREQALAQEQAKAQARELARAYDDTDTRVEEIEDPPAETNQEYPTPPDNID